LYDALRNEILTPFIYNAKIWIASVTWIIPKCTSNGAIKKSVILTLSAESFDAYRNH